MSTTVFDVALIVIGAALTVEFVVEREAQKLVS